MTMSGLVMFFEFWKFMGFLLTRILITKNNIFAKMSDQQSSI